MAKRDIHLPGEHVERLEAELRRTKERLQATIEELESTNEKLKSSNEEYQSINEELQSSNEELESSKEELQSVNEELQTVNTELDIRVRDLARANDDVRNLLAPAQIATIFLDNNLHIGSFTPTAKALFQLQQTDIGRPIDRLGLRFEFPDLTANIQNVLSKLEAIERDVTSKDGRSYIANVLPYRSIDNFIAGAVITFVDVTGTVTAESALRESESRLRMLLAELQHRVRNTLAVVKSITQRTADSSNSVDEMVAHLNGRLEAFARVQAAVTRNPDAGIDLRSLVDDELLAHAVHEGNGVAIDGPKVALRPKAAESISLALHELTTNAVKHGPLVQNNGGQIAVAWRLDGTGESRRLKFHWLEDNPGERGRKPTRHGFGMELLTRVLPYDLDARTSFELKPSGMHFEMDLPIEHLVGWSES